MNGADDIPVRCVHMENDRCPECAQRHSELNRLLRTVSLVIDPHSHMIVAPPTCPYPVDGEARCKRAMCEYGTTAFREWKWMCPEHGNLGMMFATMSRPEMLWSIVLSCMADDPAVAAEALEREVLGWASAEAAP